MNIKTVHAIASNSFWIPENNLACETNTLMSTVTSLSISQLRDITDTPLPVGLGHVCCSCSEMQQHLQC